jgi:hypothetical protein
MIRNVRYAVRFSHRNLRGLPLVSLVCRCAIGIRENYTAR